MQPTTSTVVQPIFADEVPVNQAELAASKRIAQWMVDKWVKPEYPTHVVTLVSVVDLKKRVSGALKAAA